MPDKDDNGKNKDDADGAFVDDDDDSFDVSGTMVAPAIIMPVILGALVATVKKMMSGKTAATIAMVGMTAGKSTASVIMDAVIPDIVVL